MRRYLPFIGVIHTDDVALQETQSMPSDQTISRWEETVRIHTRGDLPTLKQAIDVQEKNTGR
jgi:hypothetical protein